ncbi:MAG: hypothetical protein HY305_07405, partial [Sphingobacteriales bacterium]|nr:hypothetical protein [Sphingobacteriales bacterium]
AFSTGSISAKSRKEGNEETLSDIYIPAEKIMGFSLEGKIVLDKNNYVIGEFAKSTFKIGSDSGTHASSFARAVNFNDRSNEAFSIKLFSQYPSTNTKLTAYYRKSGEHFQSFNLYTINVNQEAWSVKVNQSFWKKRLVADVAIRKNDYENSVAVPVSFANKTVFKSLQLSLRVPKYPFVTVGYYPSSQLSLSNKNVLMESRYNTLNAILSHSYQYRHIGMNTNAMYTRFYNSSSDSSFLYFDATNYTVTQSFFLSSFMLQTNIGMSSQQDLHLFTLEEVVTYQFKKIITLTGGLKWNKVNNTKDLFGTTVGMNIILKNIGTIQLNYNKTYLPSQAKTLVPVDIGRVTFLTEF